MTARHSIAMLVSISAALTQCNQPRFALRPPITRDDDRHPVARRPRETNGTELTHAIDQAILRPISHSFAFEHSEEARNLTALDEVADSTWFTNRTPSVAEAAEGMCMGQAPVAMPLVITGGKVGGVTPGFFVRDATGRRYALKMDRFADEQPEMSTAADAIVARMYWAVGYNAPCNNVAWVSVDDLSIAPGATYTNNLGSRRPLAPANVRRSLLLGFQRPSDGRTRIALSLFVEGDPIGPFPAEGTRSDDPNDVVPHQDRRELRGERFLAAWVNHTDSREANSLDTFVHLESGQGYVKHWLLDFGDSLGLPFDDRLRGARLGRQYYFFPGAMIGDLVGFGFPRHEWDNVHIDSRAKALGYFEYEHFHPFNWVSSQPYTRFFRALPQDLAWMARKIARLTPEHVRAILVSAHLTDAAVMARLTEVLIGRRERILSQSFQTTSPLTDLRVVHGTRVCAVDLALHTGVGRGAGTRYDFELRRGAGLQRVEHAFTTVPGDTRDELCVEMPHVAGEGTMSADSPARYATLDMTRIEDEHRTALRAHFYDLGRERGYVLVGIER